MSHAHQPLIKFLNILVLLSSIAILIVISIELLSTTTILSDPFILIFHFVICSIFLADFFVRLHASRHRWHFFAHNFLLLLVAIPYFNIVYASSITLSHNAWIFLRLIPLARGIYGVSFIVTWMTRSKITTLFTTYLFILFLTIYICSIMFYFVEHGPNPMVKNYWNALNWSLMNVTTVGSNIFGVTKLGESLAVILAAAGMIFFPIFTAFMTTYFQEKRKGSNHAKE